ncbi:GNAT family N-acetyltransferase [Romboutsia lituseburensis]|uniref:GNAT family N-acetyltransferase n=1 Tax=Romboutsia lituseburensis TaxID=1537 RepID=UPI00215B762A|nr:GNAT family N-acetyltransferase [Romboutsia lituseburensis]MCR8744767.1 GNAT family N-acetyltransferase [Romboutsia lituseburensis]
MISLREANYRDFNLLFNWTNDEQVRKNSFNKEKIDLEIHKMWFNNKLKDKNTKIYIIINDEIEVGVIRLSKENNEYLISYSVDSNYRGRGIGTKAILYLNDIMKGKKLVGLVKHENIISSKVFEKAGYNKIIYNDYIKFVYQS